MDFENAIKKYGVIAAARKSSCITQAEMARKLEVSAPTLCIMEKNPESLSMKQIGQIYHAVGTDGKVMIEKFVNDFFVG